jgi:hypothetical protein
MTLAAPPPPPRTQLGPTGLAFARGDGPLVVMCGLAPHAGTTTLALALARRAAAESPAPVLLCELDAAAGALSRLTGAASSRPLLELATGGGEPGGPPFATLDDGLRLVAAAPAPAQEAPAGRIAATLREMRRAHGLTVVDAGRLDGPHAGAALAVATHVVWTAAVGADVPALATALAEQPPESAASLVAPELLAVVATLPRAAAPPMRELAASAAERCRRLVLLPHDPALADGARSAGSRGALAAIGTFLEARS